MWFYRGCAGVVLVTCLAACAGDESAAEAPQGLHPEGALYGEPGEMQGTSETPGTPVEAPDPGEGPGAPDPGPDPDPVIELPPTLDLTLPRQGGADADDLLLPSAETALLPDLFDLEKNKRRTTVTGELFLGDSEDEQKSFDVQRIQGGQIDVQVSLD